jgi:hypothetical protein
MKGMITIAKYNTDIFFYSMKNDLRLGQLLPYKLIFTVITARGFNCKRKSFYLDVPTFRTFKTA